MAGDVATITGLPQRVEKREHRSLRFIDNKNNQIYE
jgi:hypothetical protein